MFIPVFSQALCVAVRALAVTVLALLVAPVALAQPATPFIGKAGASPGEGVLPERFALVVGINRYDTTGTLGLNDLSNAENDAEGIASELKEAGFMVFVLTGGRKIKATPNSPPYVTRNEILNRISTLVNFASKSQERTGRPPIILFYFAGHGLNLDGSDYVLPSDFKPSFAEDVPSMGISMADIAMRISWAQPALRIIISDACRTRSPGVLVKRSTPTGETVTLEAGNRNTRIAESVKIRGINDLFLAFATLADDSAADAGAQGAHGKFAGAFINVLRNAREMARRQGADGHASTANEILQRTKQMMELDTTSIQGSEYVERSTSFAFHPTQKDFDLEQMVWNGTQKYTGSDPAAEAIRKALYCTVKTFILQTSYYSYFGAAALSQIHRYEDGGPINCVDSELKTTASESNDVKFFKPLEGGWVAKVPETGRPAAAVPASEDRRTRVEGTFNVAAGSAVGEHRLAEPFRRDRLRLAASSNGPVLAQSITARSDRKVDDLKIKDLPALGLDPKALLEVARFDPEARIDDLAVASADLALFADAKLTRKIGQIRAGDLLQVLSIVDQDTISVRTALPAANGSSTGFVKQRPVDSGRVAVRFQVDVHLPGIVQYDNRVVDPILQSSVLTDMQVRFPSKDKLIGFARAQIAADRFGKQSAIVDRNVRRFVPSILPTTNEKEQTEDSVWVAVTLLPLARDVRLRLLSSSGLSVRPEDAVDLSGYSEPSGRVAVSAAFSSECTAAAEDSLRAMKGKVTAYVQFMPDVQRSDSEQIRSVLNAAGFFTPAAEKVFVAPQASEIRACSDQSRGAANLARTLLEKCQLGRFATREAPTCRKGLARDTIEILLGVPKAPG
jgi:hypothetical protein